MQTKIRCVDGNTYTSDYFSEESLIEKFGSQEALDSAMDEITSLLSDFSALTHLSLIIDGREVYFNPANVISAWLIV